MDVRPHFSQYLRHRHRHRRRHRRRRQRMTWNGSRERKVGVWSWGGGGAKLGLGAAGGWLVGWLVGWVEKVVRPSECYVTVSRYEGRVGVGRYAMVVPWCSG